MVAFAERPAEMRGMGCGVSAREIHCNRRGKPDRNLAGFRKLRKFFSRPAGPASSSICLSWPNCLMLGCCGRCR